MGGKFARAAGLLWLASMLAAAPDLESKFTAVNGSRVHYLAGGAGDEAVVFVHGWTCDATFWRLQGPAFEGRRVILIDLPGHGRSEKPADVEYTMALFARAVDAALTAEGIGKATLVGHSMGTPVLVEFLRLYPERVAGLMFVDGFIFATSSVAAERKAAAVTRGKPFRSATYLTVAKKAIETMFTAQTSESLREEIRTKMLATPQHVMASAMEGMALMAPLTETFPAVPVAAVMMSRKGGGWYKEFLAKHFRLTRYEEFEGAGHFLMMEQPERFNGLLREFLNGPVKDR